MTGAVTTRPTTARRRLAYVPSEYAAKRSTNMNSRPCGGLSVSTYCRANAAQIAIHISIT
jgi:hypothetical protein